MKIVITGPKGVGKTTVGRKIAEKLNLEFIETDSLIEEIYQNKNWERKTCRQIVYDHGEEYFRNLELEAIEKASAKDWCIIATGGGTMFNLKNRLLLRKDSVIVLLKATVDLLWDRIQQTGIPPFLMTEDPRQSFEKRVQTIYEATEHICDIVYEITKVNENFAADELIDQISFFLSQMMNAPNSFGHILRVTTFGESHGKAVGVVIDGIMPGIPLSEEDIQIHLNRRRPGQSKVSSPRKEEDTIEIVSGVFEGKTTGAPICMITYNKDFDSRAYDTLKTIFRPGHADFTFWRKFGIRDHRGGGRSSGRETLSRVAAGAIALKILREHGIEIFAYAEEIAGIKGIVVDKDFIDKNPVRAADPEKAKEMEDAIVQAMHMRDSVGGIVRCIVQGVPAGLGDPVFYKLDARLAMAVMSIGAVKGIEFGSGFEAARKKGSENNDQMAGGKFLSNNAGGILGGISTGQDIVMRIAVKPTPSIGKKQKTVDTNGNDVEIEIKGRHDPCIVPRVIPVIESMVALVICDCLFIQKRLQRFACDDQNMG